MIRPSKLSLALMIGALAIGGAPAQTPPDEDPKLGAPAKGGGRIAFDSLSVNLGDVVRGEDAVASFTYHNKGDAPLHILSAKPG